MKVTKLTIHNIGLIAHEELDLNVGLKVFYGDIRQGKTTLLNSVRWVLGGAFPADIIRHEAAEAYVQLEAVDEAGKPVCIRREWYVGEDKATKARPIQYTIAGVVQKQPVDKLKAFLNPFLLNQSYFTDMSEQERAKYLVELFGVDTSEEDAAITVAANEAKLLRAKLAGYGTIDLAPVAEVDLDKIRNAITDKRLAHKTAQELVRAAYAAAKTTRATEEQAHKALEDKYTWDKNARQAVMDDITRLELEIVQLQARQTTLKDVLADTPEPVAPPLLPPVDFSEFETQLAQPADTAELEKELNEATANSVRREQYLANVERSKLRDADQLKLTQLEGLQRTKKAEKTGKLVAVTGSCGIEGLVFSEDGSFTYEGSTPGMLSTSQLIRLSGLLSDRYPAGLGIDLLDRGESLGKSVFLLQDRAVREEKTILVTVVGERPATVPEHIGAFVMENGKLS